MTKRLLKSILVSVLTMTLIFSSMTTVFAVNTLRVAKIMEIKGTVKIKKSGGEKSFSAFKGMGLSQGDTITTEKNSGVTLLIDDDKEVKLDENTKISLSELSGSKSNNNDQTGISLWYGKVWTNIKHKLSIKSKFVIKTPTTVAGARGTMFFVGESNGSTDVAVLEGTVSATAFHPVEETDESTGDQQQEVNLTLNSNEQVTFDGSSPSPDDVQVQQVTTESLDLFVLQTIQEEPQGIDPSLLQGIDQVIEQRLEQQAGEQQQQQGGQQNNSGQSQPQIIFDDSVQPPPLPSPPQPSPQQPPPPPPPPPQQSTLSLTQVGVANMYSGDDIVSVSGVHLGDTIKVYDAESGGNLIGSQTTSVNEGPANVTITGGFTTGILKIYVTVKEPGKLESNRVQVNLPSPAIDNLVILPGSTVGTTEATASVMQNNSLGIIVSNSSVTRPELGQNAPGNLVSYVSGDDISGVDATGNNFLEVYEIDSSNKIVAFTDYTLVVSDINGSMPILSNYSLGMGTLAGTVRINYAPAGTNILRYVIQPTAVVTPLSGDIFTSGLAYTPGDNINNVSAGSHIGLYEINSQDDSVVSFVDICAISSDIASSDSPLISSVTATEGGTLEGGVGAGDTMTIKFNIDTNVIPSTAYTDKAQVDAVINFKDATFGTAYSAIWTDAKTLVITCQDGTASTYQDGAGILIKSSANIRTSGDTSAPSEAASTAGMYSGSFDPSPDLMFTADASVLSVDQTPITLATTIPDGMTGWFAISGTSNFISGADMTYANQGDSIIIHPAQQGQYKLFLVNNSNGHILESTFTLTVN